MPRLQGRTKLQSEQSGFTLGDVTPRIQRMHIPYRMHTLTACLNICEAEAGRGNETRRHKPGKLDLDGTVESSKSKPGKMQAPVLGGLNTDVIGVRANVCGSSLALCSVAAAVFGDERLPNIRIQKEHQTNINGRRHLLLHLLLASPAVQA